MNEILKKAKELVELLEKQEKSGKIKLSELNPGDVFQTTGKRKYKVLEQYENTTKIVSFNLVKENVKFGDNADYLESELKELCDTEILANFEEEFGAENIETHEADLITVDGQNTGVSVKCKIRPLTFDEARKYTELTPNKKLNDWYWTCTSWSTKERGWNSVAVVSSSGYVNYVNCIYGFGVRPVCILKSNLFVSKVEE
jgi:hypothetical protein